MVIIVELSIVQLNVAKYNINCYFKLLIEITLRFQHEFDIIAPSYDDLFFTGWWSEPYFDCDGYVDEWVITYSVPFFGFNSIGSALEFK